MFLGCCLSFIDVVMEFAMLELNMVSQLVSNLHES